MMLFWLLFVILATLGMSCGSGPIKEFNVKNGTWSLYSNKLEMYFLVDNITENLKLPTMILLMGDDAYELLVNLAVPKEPTGLTYKIANELLQQHLQPTPPAIAGRYSFRIRKQNEHENIQQYVAEIQKLARNCNFGNTLGENLRDQFVHGLKSDVIRQRLFMEDDRLTFPEAVKIANEMEVADRRKKDNGADSAEVSDEENESQNNTKQVCPSPNAETPFVCPIPNGIYPGRLVRLRASTLPSAKSFSINLKCGPSKTWEFDDVALHVDFRFEQNVVARNSMNGSLPTFAERWNQWYEESYGGMPISPGDSFEAEILCLEKYFQIKINGEHFTVFYHHIPIDRITHLVMIGDVLVQSISFENEVN